MSVGQAAFVDVNCAALRRVSWIAREHFAWHGSSSQDSRDYEAPSVEPGASVGLDYRSREEGVVDDEDDRIAKFLGGSGPSHQRSAGSLRKALLPDSGRDAIPPGRVDRAGRDGIHPERLQFPRQRSNHRLDRAVDRRKPGRSRNRGPSGNRCDKRRGSVTPQVIQRRPGGEELRPELQFEPRAQVLNREIAEEPRAAAAA